MNRGSDNRRNGSSVRGEGPREGAGGERRRGAAANEVRDRSRGGRQAGDREEGEVDEYENYSLDARTGRTLVKMAHGIN